MTDNKPRRNQNPEPVRPWFARLLRRRPTPVAKPTGIPATLSEALAAGIRQGTAAAREEAERWKEHADSFAKERDGAYRERAQLLSWLAALHPSSTVITQSPDVDEDGWQLLYLVAGGWQMSWHIHPRDADLFRHVTVVDVTDPRAQWDGHGTEQKYERMRNHVRLLALEGLTADTSSTDAMREAHSA
ncbi:hypothetical protein [Streptomyces spinosisporus]|uniref:Uncharacterized protein n=1 Tax=Streptomyces spinosisporus TaxID=2927582 RepID=A0ABS9XDT8_9ACTN|nr:hypothetical protein [Streptomyces spinosisporus]MCI3240255.1 hypothetical protein [Streptomyces spinosisporus]